LNHNALLKTLTLNIVQDLATPHNNSLVQALRDLGKLRVVTWYAMQTCKDLPWKEGLGGNVDNYYFDNWRNRFRLMQSVLFKPNEKFMVIGYANFGTRFILTACWLLRRPFMYWTDHPGEKMRSPLRAILSKIALRIIRTCGRPVFVVGRHTVEKFKQLGFHDDSLVNLPIFIDLPSIHIKNPSRIALIRNRYQVRPDQVFFVGASRFTYEKGFDLLIEALASLDKRYLQCLRLLIIGTGPEYKSLQALVKRNGLTEEILFENWLEAEDYEQVISASDVFIHPARFDAFGGGTLYAMALGVPVIGSDGAGAVLERVEHEKNGLIYQVHDVQALATCVVRLIDNPEERKSMGIQARATAEKWPPSLGAQIVENSVRTYLIKE
jgi:glycosyltransferase involved in cell wall biosynthesis